MPNLQRVFEQYPEYRTMWTAPDGHIYSFPWIEQLGAGKEAIQAIGNIPYINKKWLDYLKLDVPTTTEELEQVLIAFRDNADKLEQEFDIEGGVIPMSFIINNGDQDPAILINGFGEGYGATGDHFAVKDDGTVIYTTVQEGYKEGIQWLHQLVEEKLVDPEAFTQEWSTYVAKGKNHRYGLCFTWDIANIDNNEDYVMLPALAGPDGLVNIIRQKYSEKSSGSIRRPVCNPAAYEGTGTYCICSRWSNSSERIRYFVKTYEACSCLSLTGFHESVYEASAQRRDYRHGAKSRNYVDCRRWLSWKVYLAESIGNGCVSTYIRRRSGICGD